MRTLFYLLFLCCFFCSHCHAAVNSLDEKYWYKIRETETFIEYFDVVGIVYSPTQTTTKIDVTQF